MKNKKITNQNNLRPIKAARVSLHHESVVWTLVEIKEQERKYPHVAVYSDTIHDSVIVDADWLRQSVGEEDDEAKILALALDSEPLCNGWREVHLLYIHPQ